jgi:hypothetical protein
MVDFSSEKNAPLWPSGLILSDSYIQKNTGGAVRPRTGIAARGIRVPRVHRINEFEQPGADGVSMVTGITTQWAT